MENKGGTNFCNQLYKWRWWEAYLPTECLSVCLSGTVFFCFVFWLAQSHNTLDVINTTFVSFIWFIECIIPEFIKMRICATSNSMNWSCQPPRLVSSSQPFSTCAGHLLGQPSGYHCSANWLLVCWYIKVLFLFYAHTQTHLSHHFGSNLRVQILAITVFKSSSSSLSLLVLWSSGDA